ncbi:protein disulfide isomerase CRELD2 [Nephila pilipes]|uniref:Protein disulfide isomerase CRELD2 n=1 Tax=Nephila pilipes TaxID=299642 RepID=A0A8X6QIM3_NEPPI|nr:protein disulfide isomerase CRELD2 [Nephila pilipes]
MFISNFLLGIIIFIYHNVASTELPSISNIDSLGSFPLKEKEMSSCSVCKNLVKSFLKAVDETTRQSFEGGDADWERKKLGAYENSELRFIEIQEKLCTDVTSGKDQCYNLAELYENELEDWFYEERTKNIDLFDFFCISQLKVCCPNNTYGPSCVPCPGGVANPCGGHGECMNGGTREEPASCLCDIGYTGKLCDECKAGFYQDKSSSSFSCKLCDVACKDYCRGPGPKNCTVCSEGYYFDENEGCIGTDHLDSSEINKDLSNDTEDAKMEVKNHIDNITIDPTPAEHSEL